MQVELNHIQAAGVSLALIGLVANNGLIIWFYFRIRKVLKKNGIKPGGFPLLAFYFQFRLLIKSLVSLKQQEEYQRILNMLRWSMITTIVLMVLGSLLILNG